MLRFKVKIQFLDRALNRQQAEPTDAQRGAECESCVKRDAALLAILLPFWVACAVLHVKQVASGRLAWVGVYVTAAPRGDDFPTVRGFWPGADGEAHRARSRSATAC